MNNPDYGYVKFTGDYSKLKSMGFTFQKLFANNYMQWEKDHFRVWKGGHDITHDEYNLFKLISFIENNPLVEVRSSMFNNELLGYRCVKMYRPIETNRHNYDYVEETEEISELFRNYYLRMHEYVELKKQTGVDNKDMRPEPMGDFFVISTEAVEMVKVLKDLGWYELAYHSEE